MIRLENNRFVNFNFNRIGKIYHVCDFFDNPNIFSNLIQFKVRKKFTEFPFFIL